MELAFKTISFDGKTCTILDQSLLPLKVVYRKIETPQEMADAIKTMKVRGAPLIGAAAAYGVVLSAITSKKKKDIKNAISLLKATRPTARNLFFALERMQEIVEKSPQSWLIENLVREAERIAEEDRAMCESIGAAGETLIPDNSSILTHCNAGALATCGIGTALAPIYKAKEKGKRIQVYVPETRPLLQGARLTAWELTFNNIPVTLICDSARGMILKKKLVDLCIVGADRIAKNGDTANKIGTYSLAVLAKENGIPFYVAAPKTTFDTNTECGANIIIEERGGDELRKIGKETIAPDVDVFNPAFDVTPVRYITGFITERGIIKYKSRIKI